MAKGYFFKAGDKNDVRRDDFNRGCHFTWDGVPAAMQSAAAVQARLRRMNPDAKPAEVGRIAKDIAAIVIPADIHQKLSATYGRRNTPEQIGQDSRDLRAALERDIETIRPALIERGVTDEHSLHRSLVIRLPHHQLSMWKSDA